MTDMITPSSHARQAATARWGGRGASRQIRVDLYAYEALARIPERDRRRVASDAVRQAARDYQA